MPDARLSDALIISLSRTYWDDVWRSRHHVMNGLARTNDVLFVSKAARLGEGGRHGAGQMRQVAPRLHTYVPPAWLPSMPGRPALDRALDLARRHLLERVARQYSNRARVVYLWEPALLPYADLFPNAVLCYHLFDELTLYGGRQVETRSRQLEAALDRAQVIVVASEPLAEKYGARHRVHLCPNGVDFDLFAQGGTGAALPMLSGVSRPRLVFSGTVRPQIDVDLLDYVAAARPDWSLVLVGDVAENTRETNAYRRLTARTNVRACGRHAQREVADLLAACDVGQMPYRPDGAASFCSPLKLPEYLAVGLPVVASPLAAARPFVSTVRFAETPAEWVREIDAALAQQSPVERERRLDLARQHSWTVRVDQIREWLADAVNRHRGAA